MWARGPPRCPADGYRLPPLFFPRRMSNSIPQSLLFRRGNTSKSCSVSRFGRTSRSCPDLRPRNVLFYMIHIQFYTPLFFVIRKNARKNCGRVGRMTFPRPGRNFFLLFKLLRPFLFPIFRRVFIVRDMHAASRAILRIHILYMEFPRRRTCRAINRRYFKRPITYILNSTM